MKDPVVRWTYRVVVGALVAGATYAFVVGPILSGNRWLVALYAAAVVIIVGAVAREALLVRRGFAAEDPTVFARLAEQYERRAAANPGAALAARLHRASEALLAERWADAVVLLEALDSTELPARLKPLLKNNLAYCVAMCGDGERAVEIAVAARELGRSGSKRMRACIDGTQGIACLVAGRPSEALRWIYAALAAGGDKRLTALRHFYRGEALRSLGEFDEARAAYTDAVDAGGPARWRDRARRALSTLGDTPYRAASA